MANGERSMPSGRSLQMEWLSENWVFLVVVIAMIAMHLFGHGGDGSHGGHGRDGQGRGSK